MKRNVIRKVLPGGGTYTLIEEIWGPHGGKREGAGRKTVEPDQKRQRLSTTVKPETLAWLAEQTRMNWGKSQGKIIDDLVEMFREQFVSV